MKAEKKHLLHDAVTSGNKEEVILLLKKGVNINELTEGGFPRTPLAESYWGDNYDLMKLLIEHGANTDCFVGYSQDETFLHWALNQKQFELVILAIEKGNKINTALQTGEEPIHLAAKNGTIEVIKALIKKGADINSRVKTYIRTPFVYAIKNNQEECAIEILNLGANPHLSDNDEDNAFLLACEHGMFELVQILLEKDFDFNQIYNYGRTALIQSAYGRSEKLMKFFIERGADIHVRENLLGWTALYFAVQNGFTKIVQMLLERKAKVNFEIKSEKTTPLMVACENGYLEIVKMLLDKKAKLEATDYNGYTPIFHAVMEGHLEVVKFLLEKGADIITPRGFPKHTVLDFAIDYGHLEIAKLLYYKSVELTNEEKLSPTSIHKIVLENKIELVRFFSEILDVDTQDEFGNTALHYAAYAGNAEIIILLLGHSKNINITNHYGYSCLHYASMSGNLDTIKILVENEIHLFALVQKGNFTGWSATDFAHEKNHLEIETFLKEKKVELQFPNKGLGQTYVKREHCNICGEYRLYDTSYEVLHGNPSTPASDTEVVVGYRCGNCNTETTRAGYLQ